MSNKTKTAVTEEKDPDWMYKPILNGRYTKMTKTDRDVLGNGSD